MIAFPRIRWVRKRTHRPFNVLVTKRKEFRYTVQYKGVKEMCRCASFEDCGLIADSLNAQYDGRPITHKEKAGV